MLVSCCVVALIGASLFVSLYALAPTYKIDTSAFSLGDVFALEVAGAPHLDIGPGLLSAPQIGWLVLVGVMLAPSAVYPARDLHVAGGVTLLLSGSRRRWLISKMVWVAFTVLFSVTALVVMAGVISVFLGFTFDLSLHREVFELSGVWLDHLLFVPQSVVLYMGQFLVAALAVAWLQLAFGLFLHPLLGFGVCTAYLVAGCYIENPLFIGNGMMFARWGYPIASGAVIPVILICAVCLSIVLIFIMTDVMGKLDVFERKV